MGRLIYTAIASLDGYVNDRDGGFAWAAPSDEVHAFVNERERSIGTHLLGRRMYETMAVWETDASLPEVSELMRGYAEIWRRADKIVYSTTLETAVTSRTRIERSFEPGAVSALKAAADADLGISGPTLASHALRAGLVDELSLYAVPAIIGGGTRWLPEDLRLDLELVEEHRFADGTVLLRYAVADGPV